MPILSHSFFLLLAIPNVKKIDHLMKMKQQLMPTFGAPAKCLHDGECMLCCYRVARIGRTIIVLDYTIHFLQCGLDFVEGMGKSSKKMKKVQKRDISSDDDDDNITHPLQNVYSKKYDIDDNHCDGDEEEEEYDSDMEIMNFDNKEDVYGNEDSDR